MRVCFSLIFCFAFAKAYAQTHTQQLQLQHDNDFLFAIDRYYTTGSFVRYDRSLEGNFILKRTEGFPIQITATLGQETYTPRELFETDFDLLERPYAGYLFGSAALSRATESSVWQLQSELGLAGPQSLAGDFQVAYHELINEFIPVWAGEIANSFHFNFEGVYSIDFDIEDSNLLKNVGLTSTFSAGTKAVFLEQGGTLFFGKRAKAGRSSAYNRLGDDVEFYGFAGASLKYVLHNALLSGHPFGDESPFTLDPVRVVAKFKVGLTYRGVRNTLSFVYNWQTKETDREGRWQYTSLIFARRF